MKVLYIECNMGAAGDMLMGALMELVEDKERVLKTMNNIHLPGVSFKLSESEKCGICGSHMSVIINGKEEDQWVECCLDNHIHEDHHEHEHHHEHEDHHEHEHHHEHHHEHNGYRDIEKLINSLELSPKVKTNALEIYRIIAEAESKAHNMSVEQIHFHEVGTIDAVADILGNCILMEEIGADRVIVSPICVGAGTVKCAHGILPVPAPATANILEGIPVYGSDFDGELCTPTGAAVLRYFGEDFGPMPVMTLEKTGYGMGNKDFPKANCVRTFLGDLTIDAIELSCNIDDMTGEEMGFALETLLKEGALDAWNEFIIMKKSRPAFKLSVLIRPEDEDRMTKLIFKHTTTIGIRRLVCKRSTLSRREETCETHFGPVRFKISEGFEQKRVKAEYEDIAKIAEDNKKTFREIKEEIKKYEES